MIRFKQLIIALLIVSLLFTTPVSAESADNIVCNGSGTAGQTSVGGLVAPVVSLIVTVATLITVVVGAGFTLADAAKPTGDYGKRRNQSIMHGGSTLVVLYGSNSLISLIDPSLSYSCVLPFA